MPILYKSPALAKLFGLPYFPITANMIAFGGMGPLGMILDLPSKIRIRVLDPITFDVEPDRPRYSRSLIMDESERIRQLIQEALYDMRSEEHTSELQSLMRISYAVFCLKKKTQTILHKYINKINDY